MISNLGAGRKSVSPFAERKTTLGEAILGRFLGNPYEEWATCIGCNGATALLIWSGIRANQLHECAIFPDFAIGTIGQAGKTGTLRGPVEVCQLPYPSVLPAARATAPTVSPDAASMADDRVEPAAKGFRHP